MHVWVTGNGVAFAEKRYESPSFDQKKPLQEKFTPQCGFIFIFEASHSISTELNIRLLKQKTKREAIHPSEINLASKSNSNSTKPNSHLAKKREHKQRLHSAQITSMHK